MASNVERKDRAGSLDPRGPPWRKLNILPWSYHPTLECLRALMSWLQLQLLANCTPWEAAGGCSSAQAPAAPMGDRGVLSSSCLNKDRAQLWRAFGEGTSNLETRIFCSFCLSAFQLFIKYFGNEHEKL